MRDCCVPQDIGDYHGLDGAIPRQYEVEINPQTKLEKEAVQNFFKSEHPWILS